MSVYLAISFSSRSTSAIRDEAVVVNKRVVLGLLRLLWMDEIRAIHYSCVLAGRPDVIGLRYSITKM